MAVRSDARRHFFAFCRRRAQGAAFCVVERGLAHAERPRFGRQGAVWRNLLAARLLRAVPWLVA